VRVEACADVGVVPQRQDVDGRIGQGFFDAGERRRRIVLHHQCRQCGGIGRSCRRAEEVGQRVSVAGRVGEEEGRVAAIGRGEIHPARDGRDVAFALFIEQQRRAALRREVLGARRGLAEGGCIVEPGGADRNGSGGIRVAIGCGAVRGEFVDRRRSVDDHLDEVGIVGGACAQIFAESDREIAGSQLRNFQRVAADIVRTDSPDKASGAVEEQKIKVGLCARATADREERLVPLEDEDRGTAHRNAQPGIDAGAGIEIEQCPGFAA